MTTLAFALAATIKHDGHGGIADLLSTPEEAAAWLTDNQPLVAPNWTLYTLHADEVEFWQAAPGRRHLRLQYRLDENWTKELLWP